MDSEEESHMTIAEFVKDTDPIRDVVLNSMIANPSRTIERAKSQLHSAAPDADTAKALKILDNAWIAVQKAKATCR